MSAGDSDPAGPLPDVLADGVAVLICGFNPGTRSGRIGHHYAGRGNQFWPLLAAAGLTPRLLRPEEDHRVTEWGLGLTNLVARATPGVDDLTRAELRAGAPRLGRLVERWRPRIIAYTGKGVYLAAAGRTRAPWGLQPDRLFGNTLDYVMPSPSGRVQMSFEEKLVWYKGLRELAASA